MVTRPVAIHTSASATYRSRIAVSGWQFDAGAQWGIKIPSNYSVVSIGPGSEGGSAPNYIGTHLGLATVGGNW